MPLQKTWLEEMVKAVEIYNKNDPEKKTVIRGIEAALLPWCFCNFGCFSEVLKKYRLNEKFPIAEDTDLFSRLRRDGYNGLELPIAPVLHKRRYKGFIKTIKLHYTYGKLLTIIKQKYGFIDFNNNEKGSSLLKRELTIIFSRIFYLIGAIIGFLMSKQANEMKDWREEQKIVFDEIARKSSTGHQYIYSKKAIKFLDNIIPKDVKILDVGCGTGHYAEVLSDREWYGVDISPESIKKAKKHYKEAKVGDVTKHIPYPDNSFNHILALAILHHCYREYPNIIKEIKRVAKNGAEVIIIDHDSRNVHIKNYVSGRFTKLSPTDEKVLDFEEVKKVLLDNNFEIKQELFPPSIEADQQYLKPSIFSKIVKFPIIMLFDTIYRLRTKNSFLMKDFVIIAKVKK